MYIHVVEPGENIWNVAASYGVSAARVMSDNGVADPSLLVPGQALVILKPVITHTVTAGDTLASIAAQYGSTVLQLIQNNPALTAQPALYPGEVLAVTFEGERLRQMTVNGYVYPHVNRGVLEYALPFLTYLTIFGYGFHSDGTLIPADDAALIEMARSYNTAPVMLLSGVTENGTFSDEQLAAVLQNPQAQQNLINNILSVLYAKRYVGLDLDFEFISPELGSLYAAFVENTTVQLNRAGFFVNTDLAPKTGAAQTGLLYEAHDYAALGRVSNTVLLMTYEWGYTYGPPMAVAPLDRVQEVLSYALTEIPAGKILLGIPNYGYVWPLPYERGVTAATTIGNLQAVQIAAQNGVTILFDGVAQSPFFYFADRTGRNHVVWFEDARSIDQKLRLAAGHALKGVGYWNLMRPFPQNWALVNALFTVEKVLTGGNRV